MIAALEHYQGRASFVGLVGEAIFLIDAAWPASRQIKAQGFRLAEPFKGVSHGVAQIR